MSRRVIREFRSFRELSDWFRAAYPDLSKRKVFTRPMPVQPVLTSHERKQRRN